MNNETLNVCGTEMAIREYAGQRVVTFKDIDKVHNRPDGTARWRFHDNRKRFIKGVDFFKITPQTLENTELCEKRTFGIETVSPRGTIFLTEQGYLMIVKSLTDDLAWAVQRKLVSSYFKIKEEKKHALSEEYALRLAELVNNTPPENMPIIREIFAQAGIHIPEHITTCSTYQGTDVITNFLQGVNVVGRPSSDVYAEYRDWCSMNGTVPVSNIAFSKIVNKILATHVKPMKVCGVCRRVFIH